MPLKRIIVQMTPIKQPGSFDYNSLLSLDHAITKNNAQTIDNDDNKWIVNNVALRQIRHRILALLLRSWKKEEVKACDLIVKTCLNLPMGTYVHTY